METLLQHTMEMCTTATINSSNSSSTLMLCRICISNFDRSGMISIFGEDSLWKKIKAFADVEIKEGDNLPQQVCVTCAKNITHICIFKNKCEEADSFYRLELLKRLDKREATNNHVITIPESSSDEDENSKVDEQEDDSEEEEPFDFSSIHLTEPDYNIDLDDDDDDDSSSSGSEDNLPLIPEIQLLTPQDEEQLQNNFKCPICFQIYSEERLLKFHIQTVHATETTEIYPEYPTQPPTYECPTCQKTYLNRRFMEKHVRRGRCVRKRRNQTRPMQCSECLVLFPTGHHLGWHKRNGCPSANGTNNNVSQNAAVSTQSSKNMKLGVKKQKGRTRIKLDSKMILRAKKMIRRRATASQIADELKISRTFAWRLRKSLVTGASLNGRDIGTVDQYPSSEENTDENGDQTENNILPKDENQFENNSDVNASAASSTQAYASLPGCSNSIDLDDHDNSDRKSGYQRKNRLGKKKPRKPNVFLDAEKYEKAKILVEQNISTIEIAKQLNVSQMTAWKVRDSINKGQTLTFREKQSQDNSTISSKMKDEASKKSNKQRLRAAEKMERDKEITSIILGLIDKDVNIQYWKISERLSEKGFNMSTSSVCQKLKALGLQRRWKQGDKSPVDINAMKLNSSEYYDDGEEQQLHYDSDNGEDGEPDLSMNGAHFLSAFTH